MYFLSALGCRCGCPAIDPKLEERNGGCEGREDCDTRLFRTRSVERHGWTWCEAMDKDLEHHFLRANTLLQAAEYPRNAFSS